MDRLTSTAVSLVLLLGAGCSTQQVHAAGEEAGESVFVSLFGWIVAGPIGAALGPIAKWIGGWIGDLGATVLAGPESGDVPDGEGGGGLLSIPPLFDSPLAPGLKNLVLIGGIGLLAFCWLTGRWIFNKRRR